MDSRMQCVKPRHGVAYIAYIACVADIESTSIYSLHCDVVFRLECRII